MYFGQYVAVKELQIRDEDEKDMKMRRVDTMVKAELNHTWYLHLNFTPLIGRRIQASLLDKRTAVPSSRNSAARPG